MKHINPDNTTGKAYAQMPDAEYRSAEGLSNSMLKEFRRTPAHYKASLSQPHKDTKALNFGTALHSMVLTPELEGVVVSPEYDARTNAGKAIRDEFKAKSVGKTVVTVEEHAQLIGMLDSVMMHPKARSIIEGCAYKELSLFTKIFGVDCKGRMDLVDVEKGFIGDLKSCEDASIEAVRKSIRNYGYDMQNVHYEGLFEKTFERELEAFEFIFVEKEPPYAVAVYSIGDITLDRTRKEWTELLTKFDVCKTGDFWPCYGTNVVTIEI
jgi:hypothetical protein